MKLFREHYLLTLLQSYSFVLTSTLEALGVKWQRLGITFNDLAARFFEQIPYAVLSSVLVSIRNITEDDILKFQENPDYESEKSTKMLISNDDVNHNSTHTEDFDQKTEFSETGKEFRLTKKKTRFLLHLLNDVHKFI
ncbi:uncharacterized protein LOC111705020 [Eurytemora carolleeae]|uniref:uncharacterized protein LOC111705020 n=1 Tax=Eurytemora carolleeae TaxID=1294199 RepID=UPI000C78BA18|nr:uncharacterized protein LOC111705020 [Eurytemora carolleeae]|eukprot:XP_023333218.1 uncharacterized protein LOC111705020 [Eurytemora affinis]